MTPHVHRSVDVAIVGGGTAALAAYHAAVARTPSVVLIGPGAKGTTCTRVGCMPSKLLLAAAEAAHAARHADRFGIDCSVQVDGRAVMERLRRERDRFVDHSVADTNRIPAESRILGCARFTALRVLEVNGQSIEARAVVIATGSSPSVPSAFNAVRDRVVVSDDVFAWTTLPESISWRGLISRSSRSTRCSRCPSTTPSWKKGSAPRYSTRAGSAVRSTRDATAP